MNKYFGKYVPVPAWFDNYRGGRMDLREDFARELGNSRDPKVDPARMWLHWMGIEESVELVTARIRMQGLHSVWSVWRRNRIRQYKSSQLEEIMASDSVGQLEIYRTLGAVKLHRSAVATILSNDGTVEVSKHLLRDVNLMESLFSTQEQLQIICCYCRSDEKIIALLNEMVRRGVRISECVDAAGFTPLTYTLFGHGEYGSYGRLGCRESPSRLNEFLISHGCNPNKRDFLGVSWLDASSEYYRTAPMVDNDNSGSLGSACGSEKVRMDSAGLR